MRYCVPDDQKHLFHRLVNVGFSSEQARCILQVIEERQVMTLNDLATKRDLEELRMINKRDIALLESKLTRRMTLGLIAMVALSLASPYLPDIIRFLTTLMK